MRQIIFILTITLVITVQAAEKKKVFKKTQEVNFESTDVDGLVRSPDGAYLNQKKGVKFLPLYKVEKAFDREIKNSVDYLR
jgi:hypothetical protein